MDPIILFLETGGVYELDEVTVLIPNILDR